MSKVISEDPCPCFLGVSAVIVSPTMRRLMELVERVARTSAAVLITGETGSGKEIVARAIHHFSLRSSKSWVDVNCGALPDQLMESELFGHEKGAFSGADTVKPGLFELANHGTLFLDEVGELEPRMQVKLLRVLDGVPYYRVGGQKKIEVDTRVLAATNRNLEEAVSQGHFRGDLYHRLNQCQVRVPPLRERREDIVPLAEHFLKLHSEQAFFSEEAKELLRRSDWPGNAREVRNVVTTALIHSRGYEIGTGELGALHPARIKSPRAATGLRLDGLERDAIFEALHKTGGHHQEAARLLGISRRTLSRKLKLYGPNAESESKYAYETVSGG
ncbi:MAG: sigma-54 dependent transcriptional regulator [Acidobacteriia bacterium]|nr:sigma-54 dependent transcriptional regulator [Terriglobia bacterium]